MADESWRGKIGGLEAQALDEFLDEPQLARLACLDAEGWPYVVPCWQEWDGSSFWVVPRERSAWARHLQRDERCAITVDESGRLRKVIARCRAHLVEEPNVGGKWVEIAKRMSLRYLGENGVRYLEPTLDKKRWLFRLEPLDMSTWQGTDWARRYR